MIHCDEQEPIAQSIDDAYMCCDERSSEVRNKDALTNVGSWWRVHALFRGTSGFVALAKWL